MRLPPHARHNSQPCALRFHCCGFLEDLLSGFPWARRGWGVLSTKTSKPCRGGDNMPIFSSFLCLEAQRWTGDCPEYDWKLKSCIPFCPAVCQSKHSSAEERKAPAQVFPWRSPWHCTFPPPVLLRDWHGPRGSWLPEESGCMSLCLLCTCCTKGHKQAIRTS